MMDNFEYTLSDGEFRRVREKLYALASISLSEAKRTLIVSRLSKVMRATGASSFDEYLDLLEQRGTPEMAQDFVNALTTNLTRFYREDHHFSHLVPYVGGLIRRAEGSSRRLRIWSAGCSTGQEPYTIAMVLLRAYPELRRWDFRILATDIDTEVLRRAASATYPESELNGLAADRAALFEAAGEGRIRVPQSVASLVAFRPLNLMQPWPMRGQFDAVFCRNVAIYFDKGTQADLFGRLGGVLTPGGFLYIGHSENIPAGVGGLRLVGKTVYQVPAGSQAKDAA